MSITLTGTFTRLDGAPASGTVRVTPSRSPILDSTGKVIISGPQVFPLDKDGKLTVQVPASNDPDLGPAFTYTVEAILSHKPWKISKVWIPHGSTTVDLSEIADYTPLPGEPTRTVTVPADGEDGQVLVWDGAGFSWDWPPAGSLDRGYAPADGTSFDDLPNGRWYVPNAGTATALGLPVVAHGRIEIERWGSSGYGIATFTTRTQPAQVWSYIWGASGPEGGWQRVTPLVRPVQTATSSDVLDSLPTGVYRVNTGTVAQSLGLPVDAHGVITVDRWGVGGLGTGVATFISRTQPAEVWSYIWGASGPEGGWQRVSGSTTAPAPAPAMDYGIRHRLLEARHAAAIGGPIDVGTKTPVCFVWDDYPVYMRDRGIVALAAQHNIPINFAICSRTLDPGYEHLLGGGGTAGTITWAEIDQWVADGIVELSHHGATHATTITEDSFHEEIVDSLAVLQAHSPSGPISTWVMPTNEWPGLSSGPDADAWASEAGQLILGHHAYAMGTWRIDPATSAVPMTGTPIQGQMRAWVESASLTPQARKNLVTNRYGTGKGIVLGAHAAFIGADGRWDQAEVEDYFAWLAAERDAGRIELMHLSRWAWAVSTSA